MATHRCHSGICDLPVTWEPCCHHPRAVAHVTTERMNAKAAWESKTHSHSFHPCCLRARLVSVYNILQNSIWGHLGEEGDVEKDNGPALSRSLKSGKIFTRYQEPRQQDRTTALATVTIPPPNHPQLPEPTAHGCPLSPKVVTGVTRWTNDFLFREEAGRVQPPSPPDAPLLLTPPWLCISTCPYLP